MRHLSLFSGVGGFDLGFERAGMTSIGQVEFDKHARQVLDAHWPDVPRWNDVRKVTADDLPNRIDVLSGGFPCQDISLLGSRTGLDGERSGLWFEFARLIADIAPRWVCIENVAGLLSSNEGRDLGTITGFLGDNGFRWAFRLLDAQWFGVAQRRRRVFIVASRGNGDPTEVLFEPESCTWDHLPDRTERNDNAGTIGRSPVFSVSEGMGGVVSVTEELAPTLTKGGGKPGQGYSAVIQDRRIRRLMPVEYERLQGFPDGWSSDHTTESAAYAQMGNAVCVNVVEWIGRRIVAAD